MNDDRELILNIQEWLDSEGFLYQERTNELIANSCFNCGRSKKLYINKETGVFNCFRCGIRGNAVSLVMKIGNIKFKKALELCYGKTGSINVNQELTESNEELFKIKNKKHEKKKEENPGPIKLPFYFHKITKEDSLYWEYLKKRGLTEDMIKTIPLYVWKDAKRVVFTIETDNEIMGYMARDITGLQDPKTLNSKGLFRRFNFWNYDSVKDKDSIIICEGIFSAIKCGPERTIALLGKTATKEQIELLRTTNAKKIIMCLDVDTDEDQLKMYEELSLFYPGNVFRIELPPVIELKKEVPNSIIEDINKKFKVNIIKNNEKEITFLPKDKKIIKDFFKSKKLIILQQESMDFLKFLEKSDYKDSGDYSFEEMNKFIELAKPYKRDIFF